MIFQSERGVPTVKRTGMVHMNKIKGGVELKKEVKIPYTSYVKDFDKLTELYGEELNKKLNATLKSRINKYNRPIYLYITNDYYQKQQDDNKKCSYYRLIIKYDVYEYARYSYQAKLIEYDKLIEKQRYKNENEKPKGLFSFFCKKEVQRDYQQEKDNYINSYIMNYMDFFKIQFGILKLSQSLAKELENAVLLSLRFDLIKPIIILDNIIEKIYSFMETAKQFKGENAMSNFIDLSIKDFTDYINKQINSIRRIDDTLIYEELAISDDLKNKMNEMKKDLFKSEEDEEVPSLTANES